jgi:hypothetical protein
MYNRLATLYVHHATFEMIHLSAKGAFSSNTYVQLDAFCHADFSLLSPQRTRLSYDNRYALSSYILPLINGYSTVYTCLGREPVFHLSTLAPNLNTIVCAPSEYLISPIS